MITNIRLELSDEDRRDLARRIDRDPVTKRLVTRKEVTELVLALIAQEITTGWESTTDDRGPQLEKVTDPCIEAAQEGIFSTGFKPSRGDEPYLAQPADPGIAAACSRILDDAALIEKFAWDTVERNRK